MERETVPWMDAHEYLRGIECRFFPETDSPIRLSCRSQITRRSQDELEGLPHRQWPDGESGECGEGPKWDEWDE